MEIVGIMVRGKSYVVRHMYVGSMIDRAFWQRELNNSLHVSKDCQGTSQILGASWGHGGFRESGLSDFGIRDAGI